MTSQIFNYMGTTALPRAPSCAEFRSNWRVFEGKTRKNTWRFLKIKNLQFFLRGCCLLDRKTQEKKITREYGQVLAQKFIALPRH